MRARVCVFTHTQQLQNAAWSPHHAGSPVQGSACLFPLLLFGSVEFTQQQRKGKRWTCSLAEHAMAQSSREAHSSAACTPLKITVEKHVWWKQGIASSTHRHAAGILITRPAAIEVKLAHVGPQVLRRAAAPRFAGRHRLGVVCG
eukprot:1144747-Pelagomonas_calceolata.AAC.4